MAWWKQAVVSAVLLAGAAGTYVYRGELAVLVSPGAAAEGPKGQGRSSVGTPVIVAGVDMVPDDLTYSAIGTGFALKSVTLRAPSSGEIVELAIAPGRRFAAGETLLQLDDTDMRLALDLAEARLSRATSERDRYRRLQDTGVTAQVRLEEVLTDFRVAQIGLEQAKADLADRTLRAPFDGVAGLASVEVGDRIAIDDTISSFDDRSQILVEFDVPEAFLGRISHGQDVVATTPSVEDRAFEGQITAIDSRVDAATRTARVRAAIDNAGDALRPGASFALDISLPGKEFPAVPELALQFSRGTLHVWRVKDGAAEQVEVRLVRRRAGMVIVDGALTPQDRVVIEGTQRLRPGTAVEVLNSDVDANT